MALRNLSPVPIQTPFTGPGAAGVSWPWLNWFNHVWQSLANVSIPGPYTNDAAAAAAGVPINSPYFIANGAVQVRLK